jgi:hypothetical protein
MPVVKTIVCIVFVGTITVVGGQQSNLSGKKRAVILPREVALPVIVQQPNCPLRIVKFERLLLLDGGARNRYEVRNERSQPIRIYYIAEVNSLGTGYMFGRRIEPPGKLLMPGESDAQDDADDQIEIVPLTKQIRDQLKLEEPLKAVMFLMVVRVEFADGTIYEDDQTKEALTTFFLDNPIDPQPSKKRQPKR